MMRFIRPLDALERLRPRPRQRSPRPAKESAPRSADARTSAPASRGSGRSKASTPKARMTAISRSEEEEAREHLREQVLGPPHRRRGHELQGLLDARVRRSRSRCPRCPCAMRFRPRSPGSRKSMYRDPFSCTSSSRTGDRVPAAGGSLDGVVHLEAGERASRAGSGRSGRRAGQPFSTRSAIFPVRSACAPGLERSRRDRLRERGRRRAPREAGRSAPDR